MGRKLRRDVGAGDKGARHTCPKEDVEAISAIPFPQAEHEDRKSKGSGWLLGKHQSLCIGNRNVLSTVICAQHERRRAFSYGLLCLLNSPVYGNYYYPTLWARKLRPQGIVTKLVSGIAGQTWMRVHARGSGRGEAERLPTGAVASSGRSPRGPVG